MRTLLCEPGNLWGMLNGPQTNTHTHRDTKLKLQSRPNPTIYLCNLAIMTWVEGEKFDPIFLIFHLFLSTLPTISNHISWTHQRRSMWRRNKKKTKHIKIAKITGKMKRPRGIIIAERQGYWRVNRVCAINFYELVKALKELWFSLGYIFFLIFCCWLFYDKITMLRTIRWNDAENLTRAICDDIIKIRGV